MVSYQTRPQRSSGPKIRDRSIQNDRRAGARPADTTALSIAAAEQAASAIRGAIARKGKARITAATGASQIEFLAALTSFPDIEWSRVELFHLDEYIGWPGDHPASFRAYLQQHLIGKTGIVNCHLLDVDTMREAGRAIAAEIVDIAFVGIGENSHLAFNDPPADFETEEPFAVVRLDEACRRQQVGEGWFRSLDQVPRTAISMSIRQIMKAQEIVAVVPDLRKARAVQECLEGPVSPAAPASILREHAGATVYLDSHSASLLAAKV